MALEPAELALVVIGRNEGDRLTRCLASVLAPDRLVVYVDSASTDGSAARAVAMGADVIEFDTERPFTAARARNAGLQRALALKPKTTFVQFVDGDCELDVAWIEAAMKFLTSSPGVAVVCGRLRERNPTASVYNRLCDLEWDTPIGETKACGGIAMMRAEALRQVGGFRDSLIAGEEPELCVRLRRSGWRIWRVDCEMALHDAAMTKFSQWWRRTQRGGHAFAEGAFLHGAPPERHWVAETHRALAWGIGVPVLIAALTALTGPAGLLASLIYPLQVIRLATQGSGAGASRWPRAIFLVLGKFPEALGVLKFHGRRWAGSRSALIEYKH